MIFIQVLRGVQVSLACMFGAVGALDELVAQAGREAFGCATLSHALYSSVTW